MIVRGTTPYHNFILPLKRDEIKDLYITYMQNEEVVLEKGTEEIVLEDANEDLENTSIEDTEEEVLTSATVHLTQEDTFNFKFYPAAEKNIAVIQIRVITVDNEAYASDPIKERIFGVLKEGVI